MTLIDKAEALAVLRKAQTTSCTCQIKTPDPEWHSYNCRYRILREAEAMIDHLPDAALPARGVGVKPLVWEDFDGLGAKASAFYQANYLIQWWKGQGSYEVALSYPGYQTGYDGERWQDTLEAAKAAAQADYEARIRAALEAALHVNETPKSEHDGADVLTVAQAREAALRSLASFVSGMDEPTFFSFANDMDRAFETHRATEASDRILALIGEDRT